jgi:hypothetical protein
MGQRKGRGLSAALWVAAFIVTVALAFFQRITGPSHPSRGAVTLADGQELRYRLPRSNEGRDSLVISLPQPAGDARVAVEWRRYPTDEPYRTMVMEPSSSGRLEASISRLPAAAKVEYTIRVETGGIEVQVPPGETVVARFRDPVPAAVLVPHILAMFASMLVSTRALFEVARRSAPRGRGLVFTAIGLLVIGGLFLGPLVQKFAFGAYWTGWPFGTDLTDNKTLIAFLAWLPATVAAVKGLRTRVAVALGWVVMMGVFLIPHSLRGSELDWSESGSAAGASEVRDGGREAG